MNNNELVNNGMEIMISLVKAIEEAGGSVSTILNGLKNKSAYDLIGELSTNKIRFVYSEGLK